MLNQLPVTVTGSSNWTVMVELRATLAALLDGVVINTLGPRAPPEHGEVGEAVLRGSGAAAVKSTLLPLVSLQPLLSLNAARVLPRVGAGAAPSKQTAVLP